MDWLKLFAVTCRSTSDFLGFPNWYRHLECDADGRVIFSELGDIWVVGANIIDILLRLAGILAVIFIIYGGILYTTSQGEPERVNKAKTVLTNSIIGLLVAIFSATIVGFVAGQF